MPDKPVLPEDHDFTPLQIGIASQSIEAQLEKGAIAKQFDKSRPNHEKFAWLWKLEPVHRVLDLQDEFCGKDNVLANQHRREGNRYFAKNSFLSATESYTKAIKCAPLEPPPAPGLNEDTATPETAAKPESAKQQDDVTGTAQHDGVTAATDKPATAPAQPEVEQEHELPLAYANRSAALLRLRRFQLCIRDTELAIEHGYPKEAHFKLYDRRGKAYAEMSCQENAIENFKIAKELLDVSDLNEKHKAKWLESIEKQLAACYEINKALIRPRMDSNKFHASEFFSSFAQLEKGSLNKKKDVARTPKLLPAAHDVFPCASSALKPQYSDNKGRYFTAKQDMHIGDTAILEKPLVSVLLPEYQSNHCYSCLEKILAPIPCNQCCSVVFCSKQCRDDNWTRFHRYECKQFALFRYNWMGNLGHIAHRLVLTFGARQIIEYVRDPQPHNHINQPEMAGRSSGDADGSGGVYRNDLHAVMNLVTNISTRVPESVFDFGIFAAFLVKLLGLSHYLRDHSDDIIDLEATSSIELLAGALIQLLMMLQCNKRGIKELLYPTDFENPIPADIGVGVYPTAALLNHSCYANTFPVYYGATLALQCSRDVFAGRDVTTAYEVSFYHLERKQRQMSLKATFSFHCECVACQQVWPQWRDVESEYPNLVCEQCHREVDIADLKDKQFLTCKACKHTNDVSDCWNRLTDSHEVYSQAIENTVHGKTEEALPQLVEHMRLMQRHLDMPWKDMLACELAIINCYKLRGNKRL